MQGCRSQVSPIDVKYRDVEELLSKRGFSARLCDTGGGCYALVVEATIGRTVLVTDRLGPLTDNRREQSGWGIGVYTDESCDELVLFREVAEPTGEALIATLQTMPELHRRMSDKVTTGDARE